MFEQRLADGPPDGHLRVQRTVRVLEDVLHLRTYRAQFALGELEQVMSLEQHLVALLDGLFVARLVVGHDTVPVVLRPRAHLHSRCHLGIRARLEDGGL
ncbi:hypothetical protein HMPREF3196_00313 [Bifidobacterium bifidum]|uniref:Uncharacterized protein n=1 Tax=Bifidobacterium bifidum TaxID=1681 RepID=A0A133KSF3_BIFBI|nr:hypothetical protein HMPREF3196_00313 [Bifidobacterium bifidum]